MNGSESSQAFQSVHFFQWSVSPGALRHGVKGLDIWSAAVNVHISLDKTPHAKDSPTAGLSSSMCGACEWIHSTSMYFTHTHTHTHTFYTGKWFYNIHASLLYHNWRCKISPKKLALKGTILCSVGFQRQSRCACVVQIKPSLKLFLRILGNNLISHFHFVFH